MITDEQMYWAGLSLTPGVGPKKFQEVAERLKALNLSVADFWKLSLSDLKAQNFSEKFVAQFSQFRENWSIPKTKSKWEQRELGLSTIFDSNYPELLQQIPDRPSVLFIKGELPKKILNPIAVVGTRKITGYGKLVTELFTKELVISGCTIVSGFMYGVDITAHKMAIECGGKTIGVLGFGHDHMFPASQKQFAKEFIEKGGILVSEHPPEITPIPGNFPMRNRIVAGMSQGVLVTEAAAQSGSKITANLATDYGRDVFAVPGPITSHYSEGTKELINQGAKLVTRGRDILEEYLPQISDSADSYAKKILSQLQDDFEKKIAEVLLHQSMDSDDLSRELEVKSSDLLTALTMMEIRGVVENQKGKYLVKI
jgi:DNA processing protein